VSIQSAIHGGKPGFILADEARKTAIELLAVADELDRLEGR
jgi:hypothetical protein